MSDFKKKGGEQMRALSDNIISVGKIIEELHNEGLTKFSRSSFYRIKQKVNKKTGNLLYPDFPEPKRTAGGWRNFTREEADKAKAIIRIDQGVY